MGAALLVFIWFWVNGNSAEHLLFSNSNSKKNNSFWEWVWVGVWVGGALVLLSQFSNFGFGDIFWRRTQTWAQQHTPKHAQKQRRGGTSPKIQGLEGLEDWEGRSRRRTKIYSFVYRRFNPRHDTHTMCACSPWKIITYVTGERDIGPTDATFFSYLSTCTKTQKHLTTTTNNKQ